MNEKKLSTAKFQLPAADSPLFSFAFVFIAYFLLSLIGGSPFRVRDHAYFNFLADAFLHGQTFLRLLPKDIYDLSFFYGKYYLYWPPMPAIVLMPFVAIFGTNFSDVFFNLVVASLNAAVVAALLRAMERKGIIPTSPDQRRFLVIFFALGTAQVVIALFGNVWFTAQLLGILFVGLAYLCAVELNGAASFLLTGICVACAMVTRNHLLFTGVWPAYYLLSKNWKDKPRVFGYALLAALPVILAGVIFLYYNFERFGNPFELGISYHKMSPFFVEDYQKYGAFNLHYLPINFYYQYIYYPLPINENTLMGGSLFLLSPVFFYAFVGIIRERRDPNTWLWVLAILVTSVPILLLMGTGWRQYGPRYTLDFIIPLLLLTASGSRYASSRVLAILTAVSIVQYLPGVFLFAFLKL